MLTLALTLVVTVVILHKLSCLASTLALRVSLVPAPTRNIVNPPRA